MTLKLSLKKLAEATGVNSETIRFYQRRKIFPRPGGTMGRYSVYSEVHVERLFFIKKMQQLGFTISEIKEVVDRGAKPNQICGPTKTMVDLKKRQLEEKLTRLRDALMQLQELAHHCDSCEMSSCRILECLHHKIASGN